MYTYTLPERVPDLGTCLVFSNEVIHLDACERTLPMWMLKNVILNRNLSSQCSPFSEVDHNSP